MSVRMMTLVWELDLPDSEKLVLLALADCANDEGYCWPSIETIRKKCSKSERTIQNCIRTLGVRGHLTQRPGPHKSYDYIVHPIVRFASDTPAEIAPRNGCTPPPQRPHPTPATAAPKPSKNHKEPPKERRVRAAIPDDWIPKDFGEGSKSLEIVGAWPADELDAQLEQFKANHRAKGNTFLDPQDAWQTWVLNTRKFGIGRPQNATPQYTSASGHQYRGGDEAVMREAEKRADWATYWSARANRDGKTQSVGQAAEGIVGRVGHG